MDASTLALTEEQQQAVIKTIRLLNEKEPIHPIAAVQDELQKMGFVVLEDHLTEFLRYMSDNNEKPELQLPRILFDEHTNEIYDVS